MVKFKSNIFYLFCFTLTNLSLFGQLDHIWSKGFGSVGTDFGYSITRDSLGDIIVCGQYAGNTDFNPSSATYILPSSPYNNNGFVAKYKPDGQFVWAVGIGGPGSEHAKSVKVDKQNNIYVCGYFSNVLEFDVVSPVYTIQAQGSNSDGFIAKYTSAGQFVWGFGLGSAQYDECASLGIDSSSNCYVIGRFTGPIDFDPSPSVATLVAASTNNQTFIAKYNTAGIYQWAGALNSQMSQNVYNVSVNSIGESYISGSFNGTLDVDPSTSTTTLNSATGTMFLTKYDAGGNYLWAFNLGGASTSGIPFGNALDKDGNVYLTGEFSGNLDFDPSAAFAIITPISSLADVFLAKYSPNGTYRWAFNIGDINQPGFLRCYTVYANCRNEIYLTGQLSGLPDFDPSPSSSYTLPFIGGNYDIFVSKYDSTGNFITAISMGSTSQDLAYSMVEDHSRNVFLTGFYSGTIDMDPTSNIDTLTAPTWNEIFIAKYNTPCTIYPDITVSASNNTICAGQSVTLSVSGASNYSWSTASTSSTLIVSPTVSTTYTVYGQSDGCNSDTLSVSVNVFTCTALEQNRIQDHFSIFPNPTNDQITIFSDRELEYELTNVIGEIVLKGVIQPGEGKINVSEFPKGVYFIHTYDLGTKATHKIIKRE